MLLNILDASGTPQKLITHGQEAIVDASGTITSTGVAQTIAAASSTRSGYFLQNLGTHNMYFNDLGDATQLAGSILLAPDISVSAPWNYPINTNALSLIGTAGDNFTLKVW